MIFHGVQIYRKRRHGKKLVGKHWTCGTALPVDKCPLPLSFLNGGYREVGATHVKIFNPWIPSEISTYKNRVAQV